MGLFKKVQKKQANDFIQKTLQESENKLKRRDTLLSRKEKAWSNYKKDNDIQRLISEYEYLEEHGKEFVDYPKYALELADLYIKAGWNDKAWGLLNRLITVPDFPVHKVRNVQAKILKKEGK